MSQVTHQGVSLASAVRSRRAVVLAGLLALAATAAIVLVLTIGGTSGGPNSTSLPASHHYPLPGVRYDGGPEEGSASAAASGPNVRYDGGPEEGSSSAATGPNVRYDGGPEEGSVAGSISGR